jgi:hypothetical protein
LARFCRDNKTVVLHSSVTQLLRQPLLLLCTWALSFAHIAAG